MEESKRKRREYSRGDDPDESVPSKKKKSKTTAEPSSETDADDPEDKPKKERKSKKKKKKKRKEIETTPDPSEIECDVKKLKIDYASPKSSSSESEYEGLCTPKQVIAENLPEDVTTPEIMDFFSGKPVRVDIFPVKGHPSVCVAVFGSVQDTKEALKLTGKRLRDIAIYVKPNGNSREILRATGFSTQSTVEEIKKELLAEFNWRGEVLNIFVPENKETGGCLGVGYIYIEPNQREGSEDGKYGVDENMLLESFEIDGFPINVHKATPKLCFEAEMVGKKNFFKEVNDADEKTALKKMLLPLHTRLEDLLYTQTKISWTEKRPDITAEDYAQKINDCWAAALQRAYAALRALSGLPGPDLTRQDILDGVDAAFLASGKGIDSLKNAISFMEGGYVKEMKIYRRPRGDDVSAYEDFEIFILQLLAERPVMVTIEYLPGFASFDGQGIFCPSDMDCRLRTFEKFSIHCLLLTDNDVKDGIEYWKLHETKGPGWGEKGFIMMERHKCLIKSVVELKL